MSDVWVRSCRKHWLWCWWWVGWVGGMGHGMEVVEVHSGRIRQWDGGVCAGRDGKWDGRGWVGGNLQVETPNGVCVSLS